MQRVQESTFRFAPSLRNEILCAVICGFSIVLTCAAAGSEKQSDRQSKVLRAVLPVEHFVHSPLEDDVEYYWTPESHIIRELDDKLASFLADKEKGEGLSKDRKEQLGQIILNLASQRRQYVGFSKGGRRLVRLNVLPLAGDDDDFPRWEKEYVAVYDGGLSFWSINYDVNTKAFDSLVIHESP